MLYLMNIHNYFTIQDKKFKMKANSEYSESAVYLSAYGRAESKYDIMFSHYFLAATFWKRQVAMTSPTDLGNTH